MSSQGKNRRERQHRKSFDYVDIDPLDGKKQIMNTKVMMFADIPPQDSDRKAVPDAHNQEDFRACGVSQKG